MKTDTLSWETLQNLAHAHGLDAAGVSDTDLSVQQAVLDRWLAAGCHGDMDYMRRHRDLRSDPAHLVPGCIRVITVRLNYLTDPDWQSKSEQQLKEPGTGYISVYARGRDYHKVLRKRLAGLAQALQAEVGPFGHRVFVDSGPVLEVSLAAKSGLGWIGKHTLLLNREAGSVFFLGEILTDHPFAITPPVSAHCGTCSACISACPTDAIRDGWVDARRCISYLTIEHPGDIPEEFRAAIGNRIYGCDDCQLVCPWNKYARMSSLPDFQPRDALQPQPLTRFIAWTEADFLTHTEGSAIRRIGHERWQRNVAVALGNGPATDEALQALSSARVTATNRVKIHIDWALEQLLQRRAAAVQAD